MIRIETSFLSCSMALKTSSTIAGDSPSNGSSISSSLTLPESARAIATICCSPPESKSALVLSLSRMRGKWL